MNPLCQTAISFSEIGSCFFLDEASICYRLSIESMSKLSYVHYCQEVHTMPTTPLSSDTTALSRTTLHGNFSNTIYVTPRKKVFFKNFFQIEEECKILHSDFVFTLGPGPFVIERIFFCQDNGICLEFHDKKGEYHSINKNYFSKGILIWIFWGLWKFFRGIHEFIIFK